MFSVHINSLKTTTLGISGVGFYKPDALPSSCRRTNSVKASKELARHYCIFCR